MNIIIDTHAIFGGLTGLILAVILTLIHGVAADTLSLDGLGSVGEKLTRESFLRNLKPAVLWLVPIGILVGIVIASI